MGWRLIGGNGWALQIFKTDQARFMMVTEENEVPK